MLFASTIPFVGRQTELHRIAAFSRQATEGDGLVALWITGEAGIGKSRLIEQALPGIEEQQAIVLRARFYPEAPSSIFTLLHAALSAQPQAAIIARLSAIPDPIAVINAIRRLARLRRTVLICEDVHFLPEGGEIEFTRLLNGLVHEPIGLICTTRPGDFIAYRVALPYIIQAITLHPLLPGDLDELLAHYGVGEKEERNGTLLHQITRGVPIVIRSVLPELLDIDRRTTGAWSGNPEIAQLLHDKAAMSISSIVREVITRLAPDEHRAAATLAGLGEVFAEQSANLLLEEEAPSLLHSLQEKGIIALPMEAPRRIVGQTNGGHVWEFTHSLLHEELAAVTPLRPQQIGLLLQRNVVFYSNRPLLHLARAGHTIPDQEERVTILRLLIENFEPQISENAWGTFKPLFTAIADWFGAEKPRLPEESRVQLDLLMTASATMIAMYQPRSPEVTAMLAEILRTTRNPQTVTEGLKRTIVLSHTPPPNYKDLPQHIEEVLAEIDDMIARFPSLALHKDMFDLITSTAGKVRLHPIRNQISRMRAYLNPLLEKLRDGSLPPALFEDYHLLTGHILPLFTTEEELKDRDFLAGELYEHFGEDTYGESIFHHWGHYLIRSGRMREAYDLLYKGLGTLYKGKPTGGTPIRASLNYIEAMMGAPISYVDKNLRQMFAQAKQAMGENTHQSYVGIGLALSAMGIGKMTGEMEWGYRLAVEMVGDDPHVKDLTRYHDIFSKDVADLVDTLNSGMTPEDLQSLLAYVTGTTEDRSAAERDAITILTPPIVNLNRIYEVRAAVALLEFSASTKRSLLTPEMKERISRGLRHAIEWCFDCSGLGLIPALFKSAQKHIPAAELSGYRRRLQLLHADMCVEFDWAEVREKSSKLPLLKMLGSIALIAPNGEEQRIQGARGRRILGLIIANSLMDGTQSAEEFRSIAAEGEADSANTVRVAIARLRSLLGKDAIITGSHAAPQLNGNVVRVDLFEVLEILDECETAIQTQKPRIAKHAALKGLNMLRGEPAYPTLYGEFFDAARLDFELRLRRTILAAARFLCREEDYEEAADLLRHTFAQMPNDEVVADELITILQMIGRNAEAVSIRAKLGSNQLNDETKSVLV